MIISCPACQTRFRVDEALLSADGKKVRCSKCGHVWQAMPIGKPAPSAPPPPPVEQPSPASPPVEKADVAPETTPEAEPPAPETPVRVEPVLSARDEIDGDGESAAQETDGPEPPEDGGKGADEPTDDQRAKLAAAPQQKPHRRLWFKVIMILLIVAGLLFLTLPPDVLKKINPVRQQPADVGEVEVKPEPASPQKGGHIVGGEPPALPSADTEAR